jgi:hypothetical protein
MDIAQEIFDQHFISVLSIAPAEGNSPVRLLTDEGNEAKCFPTLFPKGTGTFHDTRPHRLTLSRYINTRILNADGRFSSNLDYIFYSQYLSEVNQVVSNVSIALRKGYAAIHLDLRSGKVANLPAFLRHFTEARPLLVVVSRRFQSRASRAVQLAKLISLLL